MNETIQINLTPDALGLLIETLLHNQKPPEPEYIVANPPLKDPFEEIKKERDRLSSENADLRATLNDFVKERDMIVVGIKHVAEKLKKQADANPLTSAPTLVDFARDLMSLIPKEFK